MNIPKSNKEKIQYYLIDKAKSFIENNLTTDKAIYDFLKVFHILFLTDDNILSKIDEDNYAKFSLDKKFINEKCIDILLCDLNNLINNNNSFKLKSDNNLFNKK